jgi:catechol 2,3-dioxygenase-like lactoylglutathione lyase family enzyme
VRTDGPGTPRRRRAISEDAHPTPEIRRVLETALYCDDLARTSAFYRRLLPHEPLVHSERLVALDAGKGTVLLLFQKGESIKSLPTPGGVVPGHEGSGPVHLAFAIDAAALRAWEDRLQSLGVEIESRVSWPRGGSSLYFRDPDGRSVELATPGTWATY